MDEQASRRVVSMNPGGGADGSPSAVPMGEPMSLNGQARGRASNEDALWSLRVLQRGRGSEFKPSTKYRDIPTLLGYLGYAYETTELPARLILQDQNLSGYI